MAFNENRNSAPNNKPRKEPVVNPEKVAKKLYSESSFTISKLSDRANRSMKDVNALTALRHTTEVQLATDAHALGIPLSEAETATLQNLSDQIQIKMDKARNEFHLAQEARVQLDKELGDLGVVADNPMRLNLRGKQEATTAMIDSVNLKFEEEQDAQVGAARWDKVRNALSKVAEQPVKEPTFGPKPPVTRTFGAENPSTSAKRIAWDDLNRKQADYDKAFAARDAIDQRGVISETDVERMIAKADAEDDAARMSQVAPGYTKEELATRMARNTHNALTPTTSGDRLTSVARSNQPFNGGLQHEVIPEDVPDKADTERMSHVAPGYTKEELAARAARTTRNAMTPTASGGRLVNVARSNQGFNEGVVNDEAEEVGDSERIAQVAPGYTKEELAERAARNTHNVITPTASGERLVHVTRSTGEYTAEGGKVAEFGHEAILAKIRNEGMINLIDNQVPVFIKRTSGEMNSNGRVEDFRHNEAIVSWPDPISGRTLRKTVKSSDLLQWQNDAKKSPETASADTEKAPVNFTQIALDLDTIKQQLANGEIKSTEQLVESLNSMGLRSAMNELLPAKSHDMSIANLTEKNDFLKGFFGGKPKFDKETAIKFFSKLEDEALKRGENARKMGSTESTHKFTNADASRIGKPSQSGVQGSLTNPSGR